MTIACVRELLDAAESAGHLADHFPELPSGFHPRHIRMLELIALRNREGKEPMPSDISEIMNVTRPGITRTLRELRELGCVNKTVDEKDNRVYHLSLTDMGWKVYERYVREGQNAIREALEGMDEDRIREAIDVLKEAHARVIRVAELHRRQMAEAETSDIYGQEGSKEEAEDHAPAGNDRTKENYLP